MGRSLGKTPFSMAHPIECVSGISQLVPRILTGDRIYTERPILGQHSSATLHSITGEIATMTDMLRHLGRLSDSLFALAMALTIVGFQIPDSATSIADGEINKFLIAQLDPLMTYATTFILVAFYWGEHTQKFSYYKKTDEIHLWLYIFYLMCLFLVPYSNALTFSYPNSVAVKIWYGANIFLIGMFSFISWTYATHNHRLVETNLERKTIVETQLKSLIEPLFALLIVAVAIIDQSVSDWVWLLFPLVYYGVEKFIEKNFAVVQKTDLVL
jgi:uncharacterized membrane protein